MTTVTDYLLQEPNWEIPVLYKRNWDTRFQISIKGSETRSGLFSWPRSGLIYTLTEIGITESNYIKRKLYKNLHNVWGIPFWTERTYLSAQANSGQPVINVNEAQYRSFEVGGLLIILSNIDEFEVLEIDSINVNEITLTDNLVTTWDENVAVYPILKARLEPTQQLSFGTSKTSGIEINATEAVDTDITHNEQIISGDFPIYRGKYVFNIRPNWIQNLDTSINHEYELMQFYGTGYKRSEITESIMSAGALFLGVDNEVLNKFIGFFDNHKGRLNNFWFPSNTKDIEITAAFDAGDTLFNINDIQWGEYWENNLLMGHFVQFIFPDGTEKYREILSVPSDTQLIIDTAIGKAITASELPNLQVSFLWISRFSNDEISIKKYNAETGEINLQFTSIFSTDDVSLSTTTTTTSSSSSSSTTSSTTS